MKKDKIMEYWRRQPFVPFDIRISDGRCLTVDHPDFLSRSRDGRCIYLVTADDRQISIDLLHIVSLELANRPSAA